MMGKCVLLLTAILALHLEGSFGNPALSQSNDETSNTITVIQDLMARVARLEENRNRDALLSRSMMDEIARLNNQNQKCEARQNQILLQLETIQSVLSRDQQEQHVLSSPANEIKQTKAMPSHCEDVRASGNLANGFYTVKGSTGKTIETIYCDFSITPGAAGYETRIGYIDIKTSPVYFYVQRNTALAPSSVIKFDLARLNTGGAMDLATGVFTAPRPGTYFFTFTAVHGDDGNNNKPIDVEIQLNGVTVGTARNWIEGSSKDDIPATLHSTLKLQTNDKIRLYLRDGVLVEYSGGHDTHFTGMLLEEELSL